MMKTLLAAVAFALLPLAAQAADAPAAEQAAPRFSLDTPIENIVADAAGKAALDTALGGDITANPSYELFKGMSFRQLAAYAPDKLKPEVLAKIEASLAAVK